MLDISDLLLLLGVEGETGGLPDDSFVGVETDECGFAVDGKVGFEYGRAVARNGSSGGSNAICIVIDCEGDDIAIGLGRLGEDEEKCIGTALGAIA